MDPFQLAYQAQQLETQERQVKYQQEYQQLLQDWERRLPGPSPMAPQPPPAIPQVFQLPYALDYTGNARWNVYLIMSKLLMNVLRTSNVDINFDIVVVGMTALYRFLPRSVAEYLAVPANPRIDLRLVVRDPNRVDYQYHLRVMRELTMLLNRSIRELGDPPTNWLRQNLQLNPDYLDSTTDGGVNSPIILSYLPIGATRAESLIFSQLFYPAMEANPSYYLFSNPPIPYIEVSGVKIANLAYIYWEIARLETTGTVPGNEIIYRFQTLSGFLENQIFTAGVCPEALNILQTYYPGSTFRTVMEFIVAEISKLAIHMGREIVSSDDLIPARNSLLFLRDQNLNRCVIKTAADLSM